MGVNKNRAVVCLFVAAFLLVPLAGTSNKLNAQSGSSYDAPQPEREKLDLEMYQRIREEGLHHSHIM